MYLRPPALNVVEGFQDLEDLPENRAGLWPIQKPSESRFKNQSSRFRNQNSRFSNYDSETNRGVGTMAKIITFDVANGRSQHRLNRAPPDLGKRRYEERFWRCSEK